MAGETHIVMDDDVLGCVPEICMMERESQMQRQEEERKSVQFRQFTKALESAFIIFKVINYCQ